MRMFLSAFFSAPSLGSFISWFLEKVLWSDRCDMWHVTLLGGVFFHFFEFCTRIPGEMIQVDGCIFFRWVAYFLFDKSEWICLTSAYLRASWSQFCLFKGRWTLFEVVVWTLFCQVSHQFFGGMMNLFGPFCSVIVSSNCVDTTS